MELHDLKPSPGATKKRKRIGRGPRVPHMHATVWAHVQRAGSEACLEAVDQRDVHAAHEADVSRLRHQARDGSD